MNDNCTSWSVGQHGLRSLIIISIKLLVLGVHCGERDAQDLLDDQIEDKEADSNLEG